jgi:hypothetical protein
MPISHLMWRKEDESSEGISRLNCLNPTIISDIVGLLAKFSGSNVCTTTTT